MVRTDTEARNDAAACVWMMDNLHYSGVSYDVTIIGLSTASSVWSPSGKVFLYLSLLSFSCSSSGLLGHFLGQLFEDKDLVCDNIMRKGQMDLV
ncbi:hypothetical protein TNCV_4667351 [Trichonephila clavipes]|nr:hypothetical protein TNCV_4667351 [Trichonephila clavipes]